MSLILDGRTIQVVKPAAPIFKATAPAQPRTVVLLARGPAGEKGDPGDAASNDGGSW